MRAERNSVVRKSSEAGDTDTAMNRMEYREIFVVIV
jgi:hypothetical protein